MSVVKTDLKTHRVDIYCTHLYDSACTFAEMHRKLGILDANNVPPTSVRNANFTKLVASNFNDADRDSEAINPWPTHKTNLPAYKKFYEYALTPYGAIIINRILEDNNCADVDKFEIRLDDSTTTRAGAHWISVPSNFPLKKHYPDGEAIDAVALIHHQFGHTRFYTGHSEPATATIEDVRITVINNGNPARMFNKFEPIYTYYNGIETINIITGEKQSGQWTFNKTDPRKFAPL